MGQVYIYIYDMNELKDNNYRLINKKTQKEIKIQILDLDEFWEINKKQKIKINWVHPVSKKIINEKCKCKVWSCMCYSKNYDLARAPYLGEQIKKRK